jgi:hypothetical protein
MHAHSALCVLQKLFMAREFVLKHIRNKHAHVVDEERERVQEEIYFENFRCVFGTVCLCVCVWIECVCVQAGSLWVAKVRCLCDCKGVCTSVCVVGCAGASVLSCCVL